MLNQELQTVYLCNSSISSFKLCWISKQEGRDMLLPLVPHPLSPLCSFLKLTINRHISRYWSSGTASCPNFLVPGSFEKKALGHLETLLGQDSVHRDSILKHADRDHGFLSSRSLSPCSYQSPARPKWDLLVSIKILESEGWRKMWLTVLAEVFYLLANFLKIQKSHIGKQGSHDHSKKLLLVAPSVNNLVVFPVTTFRGRL